MPRIIDEMPTPREVEEASAFLIACWHFYLRPTMTNDELPLVKKIAQRYEQLGPDVRMTATLQAQKVHEGR